MLLNPLGYVIQALLPLLKKQQGCIVNITDIHGINPLRNYSVYCIAKARLNMLTKSLAKELGPDIRVNTLAPGPVVPPENQPIFDAQSILNRTVLQDFGGTMAIAKAIHYLIQDAEFVTGCILSVDGGRVLRS